MEYTLGVDLGTTGVKVLLVSEKGEVVASGKGEYPLLIPRPGWVEQDVEDWWKATVCAVKGCLAQAFESQGKAVKVAAVGLSGQMHGSVFLDDRGEVLRPAILWNDQRTADQCRQITAIVGAEQ